MTRSYVTVAIPYVNARPHLGYAYELVAADVRVRAGRARGDAVRFLGGTDDNALKNVLAAEQAGVDVQTFVDANAEQFVALAGQLDVTFDDFIRTSTDPRHRPAVERLWRAAEAAGDLYVAPYSGTYCVGCEDFYTAGELTADGHCPEHLTPVESVEEENWFFKLSRYERRLIELIEGGELRIHPEPFRREVLAFLRSGLRDISVSRSIERAHGWGIPVPGDSSQVIYVWFDALTNYLSALDFGGAPDGLFASWWTDADERVHVIGKGILRFHAVYWPAFLLSAGLTLPTELWVHPYLTAEGAKLSKSAKNVIDTGAVIDLIGVDGLRWWFASDVAATVDTDVTSSRLVDRVNADLANTIGNAVSRVATLVRRRAPRPVSAGQAELSPPAASAGVATPAESAVAALASLQLRDACAVVVDAATAVNRRLDATQPWKWANEPDRADELDALLQELTGQLLGIAAALEPVAPGVAQRIRRQLAAAQAGADVAAEGRAFPRIEPIVPKITPEATAPHS